MLIIVEDFSEPQFLETFEEKKSIFNDVYEPLDKNLTDSNVGGRKRRNMRDNIFVIIDIMNSVKKN